MHPHGLVDEWIALNLQTQVRALVAQVTVLTAHVDLLVDRLADLQRDRPPVPAGCPHDEDHRMEAGSMHAPRRFYCKACRQFIDPAHDPVVPS